MKKPTPRHTKIGAAALASLVVVGLATGTVEQRLNDLEAWATRAGSTIGVPFPQTPAPTTPPPTTVPPTTVPPTTVPPTSPPPTSPPPTTPAPTTPPPTTPPPGAQCPPTCPGPNPTGPGGGVFSVTCLLDHASHDDPIVFNGISGAAHLHQFFGAKGINANTVPSQLAGSPTTCLHTDDHAAYWAPALVLKSNPKDEAQAFKPKSIFAYYQTSTPARAFPQGLVMVADATSDPSGKSGFSCSDQGPFAPLPYDCPQKTVGHIHFPDCWDGVHLDSANHRSHMSYSSSGRCDAAHPIRLVQLRVHVQYSGLKNGSKYQLALNNDGTSPAWHADFEMGWISGSLERIIANCINAGHECKQSVSV